MTTPYTNTHRTGARFTYTHHFSEFTAASQHLPPQFLTRLHPHMCGLSWQHLTTSHPLTSDSPLSPLITCFIFLLLPFLQSSDILAVIYLSFHINHKSFYLPLTFSLPLSLSPKLPPSSSSSSLHTAKHLNQLNCQKHILLSPHTQRNLLSLTPTI